MRLTLSVVSLFLLLINVLIIIGIISAFGPSTDAYGSGMQIFFLVPLLLITGGLNIGVHLILKRLDPGTSTLDVEERDNGLTATSSDIPDFGKTLRNWIKKVRKTD